MKGGLKINLPGGKKCAEIKFKIKLKKYEKK